MPFSTYALNLAMDEIANRTIQLRPHSADPGGGGTTSRIGSASVDVAAGGWTAASSGAVDNTADAAFGVLDASNAQTVTHLSGWDGTNFLFSIPMGANVTVPAGNQFTVNAGSVDLMSAAT